VSGAPPLEPDEVLLRRFPESQYQDDGLPPPQVIFNPNEKDIDGISLSRESVMTPADLGGQGSAGKRYWVARLRVAEMLEAGASLRPDMHPPGHVTVTNLPHSTRRSLPARELRERLRRVCIEVLGPFDGTVVR
jgi:hypothetical protein